MACNPDCQGPCCNRMADQRYVLMLNRLGKLKMSQLAEIIEETEIGRVLYDEYNFHDGKFCPMAIAYGCHLWHPDLISDERVRSWIQANVEPEPGNMLKGVPGEFYHGSDEERKADLLWLCRELIKSKL